MTVWHLFNDASWYTGQVESEDQPAQSTHLAPPIDYTGTEPYEPRAIWRGWGWETEPYWEPPQPGLPDLRITKLAMLNRFSDAEAIAIDLASIGATVQAAMLRRAKERVSMATFIDLSRPDTIAGVEGLEAAGLIGPGRAAEILHAPVQDHERFRGD